MVAPDRTPLHVVPEDDSSKRRQILDGASKVFMNLGFDGASMGEIARAAGVSKGTLYVYFTDKNRLFEAIVEREMLDQQKTAFNFDPGRDVGTTLREFGNAYIALLCRPEGASAIRTVMAIAERMPEVGRRSRSVIEGDFPEVTWEHSHVVVDDSGLVRTFCVYEAPDVESLTLHATRLGRHEIDSLDEIAGDVSPADFPALAHEVL